MPGWRTEPIRVRLVFQREAHLDGHLPVGHFPVFHMTARLDDLEPVDIAYRLGSLGDSGTDGILYGLGRGLGLPLYSVVLSRSIMRPSSTVPRASYSRTA